MTTLLSTVPVGSKFVAFSTDGERRLLGEFELLARKDVGNSCRRTKTGNDIALPSSQPVHVGPLPCRFSEVAPLLRRADGTISLTSLADYCRELLPDFEWVRGAADFAGCPMPSLEGPFDGIEVSMTRGFSEGWLVRVAACPRRPNTLSQREGILLAKALTIASASAGVLVLTEFFESSY